MKNKTWQYLVFALGVGGYVPLIIGGILHPAEINIASYLLWLILCGMIAYSSWKQRFPGWFMPFGWVSGQIMLIATALCIGGYTINLGREEIFLLAGIVGTASLFGVIGQSTGRWNHRILFLGGIFADILSFYPLIKQYVLPHEHPTAWFVLGWSMFLADTLINLVFVERFFVKLCLSPKKYQERFGEQKRPLHIVESALLSLENAILLGLVLFLAIK